MAISYYVTKLSENIGHTDEGYLIARDAVIARTGFQKYRGKELPQDEIKKLGLNIKPEDEVDVYRSPEEVFSQQTIGSFEGKPICDGHPSRFLASEEITPDGDDPGTYAIRDYQRGHMQNVRRGEEVLESGELPLLADMVVTDGGLITKIEDGLRELSCGYNYHLAVDESGRVLMVGMCGNHLAVVRNGRAGSEARIYDESPRVHDEVIAIESPEPKEKEIGSADVAVSGETEKKGKERYKVTNVFKHLLGLGLKAYAADADPEKLSEAVDAVKAATQEPTVRAGRANDAEPEEKKAEEKKSEEKKEEKQATDESAADPRTRMHNTLDRMLDKRAKDTKKAEDVDMDEFKNLMTEYLTEEGEEPEHEEAAANDGEASDESEEEAEGEEEGEKKKAEGRDSEFIEPIPLEEKRTAKRTGQSFDALKAFRELRPLIARQKDQKLKKAFNAITARANDAAARGLGAGSYKAFQEAARTERTEGAQGRDHLTEEQQENAKLTAEYAKRLGKPISKEVM